MNNVEALLKKIEERKEENEKKIKDIIERIKNNPAGKHYIYLSKVAYGKAIKDEGEAIAQDNKLFYVKKKSRWGYWVNPAEWHDIFFVEETKEETQARKGRKWKKSWNRALAILNESGLWTELKAEIETALTMGYKAVREMFDKKFSDKGKNTLSNIYLLSIPAKIKKMYFGKYKTKEILGEIAEALKNKKECHISEPGSNYSGQSYDTSFDYYPEQNKALYAEEYRNSGNGHYYLAISAEYALFAEDD